MKKAFQITGLVLLATVIVRESGDRKKKKIKRKIVGHL